jgi:hypothetical protein
MNDMNEDNKQLAASVESEAGIGVAGGNLVARRRLLMGAGAAAPIVLTMASMPAHANGACINPSGFISAATYASRHPGGVPSPCTTQDPNYWLRQWSVAGKPGWLKDPLPNTRTSKFSAIFGGPQLSGDPTLIQVLQGSHSNFAKYCVAAYLNSRTGVPNFPLLTDEVRGLYSTIKGVGSFPTGAKKPTIPVTTPPWNEDVAVAWLQRVMGPPQP